MITAQDLKKIFTVFATLREANASKLPFCTIIGGEIVGLEDDKAFQLVSDLAQAIEEHVKDQKNRRLDFATGILGMQDHIELPEY